MAILFPLLLNDFLFLVLVLETWLNGRFIRKTSIFQILLVAKENCNICASSATKIFTCKVQGLS